MKEKEILHYDNKKLWERLRLSESNRERVEETSRMIPEEVDSIADIGCGSGLFLNYIKENLNISTLIGVDFSEDAMKTLNTSKKLGNITNIPLESNSYDLTSALEVLEHLDLREYEKAKKELARVSSKYILVSVPFSEDLELEFVKCPKCKTRFNKSHHRRVFMENNIENLFEEEGYKNIEIKYISRRNKYLLITPLLKKYKKLTGIKNFEGTVCPVCGNQIKGSSKQQEGEVTQNKIESSFGLLPFLKRLWPKKYTHKWIASLYEKVN